MGRSDNSKSEKNLVVITILSLKTPSGKPTDAVDTVNHNVFKRISATEIKFVEAKGFIKKVGLLRKLRPDYLFGIGNVEEILYLPFKSKHTRYIIGWHTLLKKTKTWLIRKTLFSAAHFVIAVSECAAQSIRDLLPSMNVHSVLNGVDTDFFNPRRANQEYIGEKHGVDFNKPIVLCVSAQYEGKRPDVFIAVAEQFKDANFVLIGRRVNKDFTSRAKGLNNFQWIPFMDREDLSIMMASSSVFLFPSVIDACAAVVPEALASGLPVLLTNRCGNAELIEHGREGFLIEPSPREIEEFSAHLDKLLRDDGLMDRLKKQARARCMDKLSWQRAAEEYKLLITLNL